MYGNKVDSPMFDNTVIFLADGLQQVMRYCICTGSHGVFHYIRYILSGLFM